VEEWLDRSDKASTLSASRYLLHGAINDAIKRHARGRVLEAGAGGSPFKELLSEVADVVVTLDIEDRYGDVDVIADVQNMEGIPSASFDTVVCTQVLEHLPNPPRALGEFRRVLSARGKLILSAPHLSMVHEAPNDYFRYTSYGLRSLAEAEGFRVQSIIATGGIVAFLTHPVSSGVLTLSVGIPLARDLAWLMNYLVLVRGAAALDRWAGVRSLFPLDHVMVAEASHLDH
jgi:SAM-dependent methyltransferase